MDSKTQKHTSSCCSHNCGLEQKVMTQIISNQIDQDGLVTLFKVANMDCNDEIKAVNDVLRLDGVYRIQANLILAKPTFIGEKNYFEYDFRARMNPATLS